MINNYRPISLLFYLSKVLEKLITGRFDSFFIKHGILCNFQYGFRQNHSVTHALRDVTALTYDSIQNKWYTASGLPHVGIYPYSRDIYLSVESRESLRDFCG